MKPVRVGFRLLFVGGAILLACILFDRYRHQDPDFRKKLKERRRKLRKQHLPHYEIAPADIDPKFREAIIIKEIQVAERLMLQQRLEEAMVHFAQAIAVCADPAHLLNCLRQTLPVASYDLLIQILVNMYGDKYKRDKHAVEGSGEKVAVMFGSTKQKKAM